MAVVVHYCDNCGIRIEPDDVKEGKAVLSGNKAYCPECAKKLNATGQKQKKQIKPPTRKATTRAGTSQKKSPTSYAKKPKWEEPPDDYEYESKRFAPRKKKSGLPILLGVGGVVVVIIIIAIAAGGSDEPAKNNRNTQQPDYKPPAYQPDNNVPKHNPHNNAQNPPATSPALIRYKEALEYGKMNPENYQGMLDRLESILQEENVDFSLIDRIESEIRDWNGRLDAAATREWEKRSGEAKSFVEKGDYKRAIDILENYPEQFKKFNSEKRNKEITRLKRYLEAFEAFKGMESDIRKAQREFSLSQLEEAEELFQKLLAFGKKYEDVEELVVKLNPTLKQLWAKIEALEEQKFGE